MNLNKILRLIGMKKPKRMPKDEEMWYLRWRLPIRGVHDMQTKYHRMLFPDAPHQWDLSRGQRHKITYRSNQAWNHLSRVCNRIASQGAPGIYLIKRDRWGGTIFGHLWAKDLNHASQLADLLFKPMIPNAPSQLYTQFVSYGSSIEIITHNVQPLQDRKKQIQRYKEDIALLQGHIEEEKALIALMETTQVQFQNGKE